MSISPEECPSPELHGNPFRYCPSCTWTEERNVQERDLIPGDLVKVQVYNKDGGERPYWIELNARAFMTALERAGYTEVKVMEVTE
jgi:hypothetical protein